MTPRKNIPMATPDADVRPIPGYEALYSVTEDGRIWSHGKSMGVSRHGGRWLIPPSCGGYKRVFLFKDKKPKSMFVHRAVALAWIANPEGLPFVNHRDGVKANCSASNLEWCTVAENNRHAFATGLNIGPRKLTDAQIAEVRSAKGMSQAALAKIYGVSGSTIARFQRAPA